MTLSPQRKFLGDAYRPAGPKYVTTVTGLTGAAPVGFVRPVTQQVDLTLPIRGFRFVIKGRVTVATANYTSVNPESLLNLVSNIQIYGTNKRLNGNQTLTNIDLASLFGFTLLTKWASCSIQVNGVELARPGLPYSNVAALTTAASPYDFIITLDVPNAPIGSPAGAEVQYLIRTTEWKDSITFAFTFPTVTDNAANPLGTSAATTVTTLSAFGSATGAMSIDIYSLPVRMGSAQNALVPGVINRATTPQASVLQSTAGNVELLRMQKQATSRVYLKIGVGANSPTFTSLSDAILTSVGIQVGTNVNVRDVLDIFAHRAEAREHYKVQAIQGYYILDFLQSGNPDSSYAADSVLSDGQNFRLVGNVTGAANASGLILQEQIIVPAS